MAPDIVVIDYHKGNIASVVRGLTAAGGRARISDDPAEIGRADALVLPGVGSFGDAMAYLNESGQATAIKRAIEAGTPFLGICLGLQLLFDWGTEGHEDELDENGRVAGLGVLRGHCDVLPQVGLKIPHVGWDQVHLTGAGCSGFGRGFNGSVLFFRRAWQLLVSMLEGSKAGQGRAQATLGITEKAPKITKKAPESCL